MSIVTIYHRNGQIRETRPIENGMINGVVKRYSEDGKLVREISYVEGLKHGVKKQYYPDGTIKAEIPYENGSIHGIKKRYNKHGILFEKIRYNCGEYVDQLFFDSYFASGLTENEKVVKQQHEENLRVVCKSFLKESADILYNFGNYNNPTSPLHPKDYNKFPIPEDVELADIVSSVNVKFATDTLFTESSVGVSLSISNEREILVQYDCINQGEREQISRQLNFTDWQKFIDVLFNKAFCHEWAQAYYDKTDQLGYFPCNEDWGFIKISFKQPNFGYQKIATHWSGKEPPFWNIVLEGVHSLVEGLRKNEPVEQETQTRKNTFINYLIKNCSPNEFVDERDGNIYKTVKIGRQIWMAENLRYKPNVDTDCSLPTYFDYGTMVERIYRPLLDEDDDITKIWRYHKKLGLPDNIWPKFGILYRWTSDIQKLAPRGWRVPTNRDFLQLAKFLETQGDGKTAVALKSKIYWEKDKYYGCGGTDAFGFCALPSGFFYYEKKHEENPNLIWEDLGRAVGRSAHYWTSSGGSSAISWKISHVHRNQYPIEIQHEEDFLTNESLSQDTYFAIRCIREDSVVENSFPYSRIYTPPKPKFSVPPSINEDSPWNPSFGSYIDQRDGRVYRTVKIGKQEWFAEDLKFKGKGIYSPKDALESVPESWHLPSSSDIEELRYFCLDHSKNSFGTVAKSTLEWLPCTDYYKNLDENKFKEALKNSIKCAPMGIDRFGLCIKPTNAIRNCSGKLALFWLDGCRYLWSFSYYSDDSLIYRSSSSDNLAIRCVRNIEK